MVAPNAGVEKAMEIKPPVFEWKFFFFCYCMYRLISKGFSFGKGKWGEIRENLIFFQYLPLASAG